MDKEMESFLFSKDLQMLIPSFESHRINHLSLLKLMNVDDMKKIGIPVNSALTIYDSLHDKKESEEKIRKYIEDYY